MNVDNLKRGIILRLKFSDFISSRPMNNTADPGRRILHSRRDTSDCDISGLDRGSRCPVTLADLPGQRFQEL